MSSVKLEETEESASERRAKQLICIPGDVAFNLANQSMKTIFLGPGVRKCDEAIIATRVGIMQYKPPATFFLSTLGDSVGIG